MKRNAVLIAFASVLATTAADWSVASDNIPTLRDNDRDGRDRRDDDVADSDWLEGEIRQVDREAQRLVVQASGSQFLTTLRVNDRNLLALAHHGQNVRYRLDRAAVAPTMSALEVLPAQS